MIIKCGTCKFWRFKSSGEDDRAFGVCDNWRLDPIVKAHAATISVFLEDVRFEENFGCIFAERME